MCVCVHVYNGMETDFTKCNVLYGAGGVWGWYTSMFLHRDGDIERERERDRESQRESERIRESQRESERERERDKGRFLRCLPTLFCCEDVFFAWHEAGKGSGTRGPQRFPETLPGSGWGSSRESKWAWNANVGVSEHVLYYGVLHKLHLNGDSLRK